MENSQQTENKKPSNAGWKTVLVGVLITLLSGIFLAESIALDMFGEKTIGKLSNAAKNCSGSKTCWTSKVEFTTLSGEKIAIYPWTNPFFFDLDPLLSGRPYEEYGNFEVRYFENVPQRAKVSLAFRLEDLGKSLLLFLGFIILFFGVLSLISGRSGKEHTPFVIDLRKRK